jgi:alcohol dehydrogenase class IV
MDCAKAVRIASEHAMSFVAIPTTSGSGSEVTSFSILTHNGIKHPLVDPAMRPDAAILDDSLLEKLPQALIADTGMDLIAHSMEAAVARGRSAFSDAMAAAAARTAFSCLAASYQGDVSVRRKLHEAATMAGIAFENAGLGACHAMAHAIGGALHLPHGRLCAMLLPHVMAANEQSAGDAYQAMAAACGMTNSSRKMAVRSLSSAIVRLRTSLKLPATLTQAGICRETAMQHREKILQAAMSDSCLRTNPAPMTMDSLGRIYEAVL